jgi:hypothetical protein
MAREFVVRLTRVSPTEHTFAYQRPNGTGETLTLNTRSFLFHDLLHFAVETEAHLQHSFYGNLAASGGYETLSGMNDAAGGEIGITERVVGGLTGALKGDVDPATFLSLLENAFNASDEHLPDWLTTDFVDRIKERMRRLQGEWNGTPFGQSMELRFPLE